MAPADRFDPYRVLGVPRGASRAEVARAYRSLAKRLHPDLHGPDAAGRMQDLNRAFAILADPQRRAAWDGAHAGPAGAHWAGQQPAAGSAAAPHRAPGAQAPAGPGSWARWEAGPAAPAAGARVRVRPGWPRERPVPPPVAAPVRDSPWLAVVVAGALVVAIVVLGWIAATGSANRSARGAIGALGVTPDLTVPLDTTHELGVFRTAAGGLGLAAAELDGGGGWAASVVVEVPEPRPYSVLVASDPGAMAGSWRTLLFGRAGADVERVQVIGVDGEGGHVANGVWAIGLRSPLPAASIRWEFVLPDGRVVLAGTGPLGG